MNILKAANNRLRPLIQLQRGVLGRYGWWRAWKVGKPVDAQGNPLPWISYPAIDFLRQFDFSEASVFEWGSGFSTLWWTDRCHSIATVESAAAWAPYIKTLLSSKVEFLETALTADAEIEALTSYRLPKIDVIVIDNHGLFRWRCAEAAIDRVAEGGFIILDNSDQCLRACKVLRAAGFTQIDFTGFAPGVAYAQCTSFFFKNGYKFKPFGDVQPHKSLAQPNEPWPEC
jgi:hypothetical protein